jgi:hypothetical protein
VVTITTKNAENQFCQEPTHIFKFGDENCRVPIYFQLRPDE